MICERMGWAGRVGIPGSLRLPGQSKGTASRRRHTSRYASGRIRWRVSEPTLDIVEVQVASYFVIACLRQMKNEVWLL